MKKIFCLLIIAFVTKLCAGDPTGEISWIITLSTSDGSQKLSLFQEGNITEPLEGYFLCTEYEKLLDGNIVKGGFNFLDPKIIGGLTESSFMREQWVKNKFPLNDIEIMTSPVDVNQAISFNIIPELDKNNPDSISLFFKYVIFNLLKRNDESYLNSDFNISTHYKLIRIAIGQSASFDFINNDFKPFKLNLLVVNRKPMEDLYFQNESKILLQEIINSAQKSKLKETNFKFTTEFVAIDSLKQLYNKTSSSTKFLKRIRQDGMKKGNNAPQNFGKIILPVPVYQCILHFPFHLYNIQKEEDYRNYKTRDEIFNSEYNIILVPISFEKDILTADLFIQYKKINLDDLPRWTPIKKRISIQKNVGVRIDLPKENWGANFTRNGEKYEIYGYSDYERFVNESIIINFEN